MERDRDLSPADLVPSCLQELVLGQARAQTFTQFSHVRGGGQQLEASMAASQPVSRTLDS